MAVTTGLVIYWGCHLMKDRQPNRKMRSDKERDSKRREGAKHETLRRKRTRVAKRVRRVFADLNGND